MFGRSIYFRIYAAISDRESTGDGQYSRTQLRIAAFGSKNCAHNEHGVLGGERRYRFDWNVNEIVHEDTIIEVCQSMRVATESIGRNSLSGWLGTEMKPNCRQNSAA